MCIRDREWRGRMEGEVEVGKGRIRGRASRGVVGRAEGADLGEDHPSPCLW